MSRDTLGILTASQVAQFAYQAGFRGDALITAVAIAHAESYFDPNDRGDLGLVDAKWGPSIGLWQIRSLNADKGTGRTRDELANTDPLKNARAAYTVSGGGTNFTPWSTYNSGTYKQFLPDARTGASGASSAVTPTVSGVDNGVPILAITGGTGPALPLTIGGRTATGELGDAIVGGSVDFSVNAISEITVELSDPGYALHSRYQLQPNGTLHLFDLPYRVVEYRLKQGPGAPHVTLVAQAEGVVRMNEISPAPRGNISPTDYMSQVAQAAGLKFVGEASAVVPQIGPSQVPDGAIMPGAAVVTISPMRAETAWEVGQRLAGVLGFYAYESAGTYFFGSATYLTGIGQLIQLCPDGVSMGPEYGPLFEAFGIPTVTLTKRPLTDLERRIGAVTTYTSNLNHFNVVISGTVNRDNGINLRPGMRARWKGGGPLITGFAELVTRVSWDLGDVTSPVKVETGNLAARRGTGRTPADDTASSTGAVGTAGSTIGTPSILDFVTLCLRQVGKKYTWGGEDPVRGFDCSGLIQWAASQMGVSLPRTAGPQFNASSKISIEQAYRTRGAILYHGPTSSEHIVISLGDGQHTVEARGAAYGVIEGPITGRPWTGAGLLPGFAY